MARSVALALRLLSAFALLLVATFYLLGSIPFAYYQFLQSPPWKWMPVFVRVHPLLLVAAIGALVATLGPLDARARRWSRLLMIAAITLAAAMAAAFWTPGLESYELSAALCFAPLVLLTGASAIGLFAPFRDTGGDTAPSVTAPSVTAAIATAAIAGLAACVPFLANTVLWTGATLALEPREFVAGSVLALTAHVTLFAGTAAALGGVRRAGARGRWTPRAVSVALGGVVIVLAAVLMRSAVLTALMFDDRRAIAVAIALAIALVTFQMAFLARPARTRASPEAARSVGFAAVAYAAAAAACVFVLPSMVRLADWGQTLQKLLVMITWVSAASWIPDAVAGRGRRPAVAGGLLALWALFLMTGLALGARVDAAALDRRMDAALAVDRYATFDVSLRVILDVVRPVLTDRAFLNALRQEGNITDNRRLPAVPLHLVDEPRIDVAYRPHIFIVVVDSLRPDYLSAYNQAVTFTPAIGAFARDSIIMRRAFTPYAGTALSEPALWAGGLIPRAMYLKPFSSVNNLERLLIAGGYHRYISVDEVLGQILEIGDDVVRLDGQIGHPERESEAYTLDLCGTVDQLATRLDADRRDRPIFFYSQPKNLHIRVIAPGANRYDQMQPSPGAFFQPVVTAMRRLDACFGRFIADLKRQHLYDDSIIVLTSDHGDAYGEEGRWAHAFYVSPETLRIPIVMHVPERLRSARHWDADAVAWLTDLTPSLYDLAGQGPMVPRALMGRSWFARQFEPLQPPPALQLVQSSYSRIFGLVDRDARWLFTADANRGAEELFDLTVERPVRQTIPEVDRLRYEKWLRAKLGELNAYYAR